MSPVKRRELPIYFHVTEGGHDWYVQSWSDFGPRLRSQDWAIWCDECKDYHRGRQIDPLTICLKGRAVLTLRKALHQKARRRESSRERDYPH